MSDFYKSCLESDIPALTAVFKELAGNAGWPEEVSSKITVELTDGVLRLSVPPNLNTVVSDLELGTSDQKPTYVLRKFNDAIETAMERAVIKSVCRILLAGSEETVELPSF